MQQVLPQCPVCGSTSGYELSGIVGKFAKCYQCQTKWKLHLENQQLMGLVMHELPKNGAALYKVAATNAPLFIEIGKPLALPFWQGLRLDGKIDWGFLLGMVDSTILKSIIIEKSEYILNTWTGNRLIQNDKPATSLAQQRIMLQIGALLLTSRRLIWLERRQIGVWKPQATYLVALDMPLESVKGISGESGDSGNWATAKKVSIVTSDGEKTFNLQSALQEILKPQIESAIRMRANEIETEKKRDKIHVMLDFSFLKSAMEKGGLVMQVLKCPECGATVEFPKSGNETKCLHCGKTIYAQDIFEKVKGLI
jgi:ribosomal protein S27E